MSALIYPSSCSPPANSRNKGLVVAIMTWSFELKKEKIRSRTEKSSVIIAICMEREEAERIPEIEEVQAVACSVQNMYLTCTAYGIGGYWSSPKFIYSDEMKRFLGLGQKDRCLGLFYMGYPEGKWPKSHRKPLEYVTEWINEE